MDGIFTLGVIVLFTLFDSVVGEYCYESRFNFHGARETRKIHCSFGCCGPAYDEYCCVSNAGIIVGIVFAAIFGIALVASLTCCFIKNKNNRGRVIRPSGGAVAGPQAHSNVFIVPSGPAPPAYSSTVAYNPNYNPYASYAASPSAPMPPSYSQTSSGHLPQLNPNQIPPAYSKTTVPPPAYCYDPAYPPGTSAAPPAYPPQTFPPPNPPQAGAK